MNYTIQFNLFVAGDDVLDENEIVKLLLELIDEPAIYVSDIRLIDIND